MENLDIMTDIKLGQTIFKKIHPEIRPKWAGLILSLFDNYVKEIPVEIVELKSIISDKEKWSKAHEQFQRIRQFLLMHLDYKPEAYLLLAENAAKITYNASGQSGLFDNDSGGWIPSCALNAAIHFDNKTLKDEVYSTILIFEQNRKFKDDVARANEFLEYKKVDIILWLDWDPIGINDMAPRDEYQSYVPEIYNLKKSGANRVEIAKKLLKLETENIGMGSSIENCLKIADKILQI